MEVLQQSFSKNYYIVTRNQKTRKLQAIEEEKAIHQHIPYGVGVFATSKKEAVEKVKERTVTMSKCQ